jgi:hypothetical protein
VTRRVKSLGPSNDDSPLVAVEMRAAAIRGQGFGPMTTAERVGYKTHGDPVFTPGTAEERAGWLACEINVSDSLRAARDADNWAWDISRPLAEQFAETAADDAAADAMIQPSGTRTCGAEGVDEEGHCNRCGLVPDGSECPPGFFASDGAP